jgi:O-antigen/teichoic acid export membrane protein
MSLARAAAWLKLTLLASKRGIRDVVISVLPQVAAVLKGFVAAVLIARGLGSARLGEYTLVLSVSSLAVSLSDLGIGQTAIRYASRAAAKQDQEGQMAVLRWAFRLRIFLVSVVTLFFFVFAPLLADKIWKAQNLTPLIRLGLLVGIFDAMASVPVIYFRSLRRFGMNAMVQIGQAAIALGGILLLAWLGRWSVTLVLAVTLAAAGIGAFVFLLIVPKAALWPPRGFSGISLAKLADFWKSPAVDGSEQSLEGSSPNSFALFNLLSTVIVLVTMRADVWLMGVFLDQSQIGIYSVATRFTLPLTIVLGALNTALWPRASALSSATGTVALLRKTLRMGFLVSLAGVVYALIGPLVAPWLFGAQYASSVLLAQILCLRYCLAILYTPIGVIGYSFGLVRAYWWINLLQLVPVVVINVLLLPVYGPVGSALALIANEIVGFVLVWVLVRRKMSEWEKAPAKPLPSALCL